LLPFFQCPRLLPVLHSFPTRRSSDLHFRRRHSAVRPGSGGRLHPGGGAEEDGQQPPRRLQRAYYRRTGRTGTLRSFGTEAVGTKDRKSTRLNSSHVAISYAVFCLKKK